MTEKAIPRQGMAIEGGGEVTSGSLSPMLDVGIGLGYVPAAQAKPGTELMIDVRGRPRRARGREETHLQEGGVSVAASESYPDDLLYHARARLGAHRRRRGRARRHLVRAGRARRARPLRAAGRRRDRRARTRSYGEVESVKAVSDLISPLSGEVLEVNQKVVDAPETVNEDPYGEGWLIRIRMTSPAEREQLLDVADYQKVVATQ